MSVLLGMTMGDPAGIGAEILLKAVATTATDRGYDLVVIADPFVLSEAKRILASPIELVEIETIDRTRIGEMGSGRLAVYPSSRMKEEAIDYGHVQADYGKAAYQSITTAIDLAMEGAIDAVVTPPINKEALRAAGIPYAGHTEIFAARTKSDEYAMMLSHGPLRVVHVSTHVSLLEACRLVTKERVLSTIRLAASASVAIESEGGKPIAVAGLNPHAGEHGLFGSEEELYIIPAIEEAKREGINVIGPLPPDTIFSRAAGSEFSAVIAMYHDQGHIPLKLIGFTVDERTGRFSEISGVNITLGLPIIRTSVDHGTAYDLAGTGEASENSLIEALQYAWRLAQMRVKK